jgi:WD40 repeat protein
VLFLFPFFVLLSPASLRAQGPLPPGDPEPILKLEPGGPLSFVTGLAFSPDGQTLYVAGWDKVVRLWRRDGSGRYRIDLHTAYRVPIGPGVDGALNALALSPDGTWLAVGGFGLVRKTEGFRRGGQVVPAAVLSEDMLQDRGMIYVFNLKAPADRPDIRILRGHRGSVLSLAFAPAEGKQPPALVSLAQEAVPDAEAGGAVRLWDLDGRTVRDRLDDLPNPLRQSTRPGIAAWRTGGQLHVGLAIGDGRLRVWEVGTGRVIGAEDGDALHNKSALFDAALDRLVTSSYRNGEGLVRGWRLDGRRLRTDTPNIRLDTPNVSYFPRALALFSGRPGGTTDQVAVVVSPSTDAEQYVLQVRPLDGGPPRNVSLWRADKLPVVAASSAGGVVAVAGNHAQEVWVFAVADLLGKSAAVPQKVRGAGSEVRSVAFVRRGADLGLLLRETGNKERGAVPPPPKTGDWIFDFARRNLALYRPGTWQVDAPRAGGWALREERVASGRAGTFALLKDGEEKWKKDLQASQQITDYAILPADGKVPRTLLAVGFHYSGEPVLSLYDAETGTQFRQFTGHTERISALAFSADGRLLVSTAEDQTVCVWSLTDVDKVLGQRGRLPAAVGFDPQTKLLRVEGVQRGSAAAGKLKAGDRIEGFVEGDTLRRFESAYDYYEALWRIKPGTEVALRLRGRRQPVRLEVIQGIDSQKPLLTFFMTRPTLPLPALLGLGPAAALSLVLTEAAAPPERDWIGWNNLGPYDISHQRAEQYLGWHFNTGRPEAPARLARADQYRKLFRRGILQRLVAEGKLPPPEPAAAPPRPGMTLWLEGEGREMLRPDARGRFLVQEPRVRLKLALDNYPTEKLDDWIDWVKWQVMTPSGVSELVPFGPAVRREYTAELTRAQRGLVRVGAVLRTLEAEPKEYTRELTVRYQPKPPAVRVGALPQSVDRPDVAFRADIQPGEPGQAVRIHLVHLHDTGHGDRERVGEHEYTLEAGAEQKEIQASFKLRPGSNEVLLTAVNEGALAGDERDETQQVVRTVQYLLPRDPPQITLNVTPLVPGDPPATTTVATARGNAVVVDVPRVRLSGMLRAAPDAGPLVEATWGTGQGELRRLTHFQPGVQTEWSLAEEVSLQPGAGNRFRVRARSERSPASEADIAVDYRPALPQLRIVTPADPADPLIEGKDEPRTELRAVLLWSGQRHPCRAVVLVNGEQAGEPIALDAQSESLAAPVPLRLGANTVQVQLGNAWARTEISRPLTVRYLRPPTILSLQPAGGHGSIVDGGKPAVDLEARVRSALPLDLVKLRVNGAPADGVRAEKVQKGPQEPTWTVRLPAVPLHEGENRVELRAADAELAWCREPATLVVEYRAPAKPQALPPVEILDVPHRTSEPHLKLRFRVPGTQRPTLVRVMHETQGRPAVALVLDSDELRRNGTDFLGSAELDLRFGENRLTVEASEGGPPRSSEPVAVVYALRPMSVFLERLETFGGGDTWELPRDGRPLLGKVPAGSLWLYGSIQGDAPGDPQLRLPDLWVSVNRVRQPFVQLGRYDPKSPRRAFRALIVLNEATNRIEVETPNVPRGEADFRDKLVACENPVRKQRLHLLIIGPDTTDQGKLRDRTLAALGAVRETKTSFHTPAFERGVLYPPLTGLNVTRWQLTNLLGDVQRQIQRLAFAEPMNEVVMVFYQGGEDVLGPDQFRWGEDSWGTMEASFAETPGAAVLFLDVTRPRGPEVASDGSTSWPGDARLSVIRYAYEGGAPPEEARLLRALEEIMPRTVRLKDLADRLGDQFRRLSGRFTGLRRPDLYVPSYLQSLAIGRLPS